MNILGFTLELLALFTGLAGILFYILSITSNNNLISERYRGYGNIFLAAQAIVVTMAVVLLLNALVFDNFRLIYVHSNSDRSLPLLYKITALWGGQAGSLLFWGWLASLFSLIELRRMRNYDGKYQSYMFAMLILITTFFLFLCAVYKNPFSAMPFTPADGRGMNPLLQNPGMVIHPPLLYIGFVGFMIPFAHAFASLSLKKLDSAWIKLSRGWSLFTWSFLTAGIVLGAWWAYVELGWGGYWAWDPVENASLFPWLTATAFLHSAIIYERKGRLKVWSFMLILITFELTIFGTYLTRSGVMTNSVHSFGQSNLGNIFLIFIVFTIILYLRVLYGNSKGLTDKEEFNFSSKEGVFFMAILSLVSLTLALLFYTMFPILSKFFIGEQQVVKTSSYNLVSVPFFIVIFLLAGLAPALSYGKSSLNKFAQAYLPIAVGGLIAAMLISYFGYKSKILLLVDFAAVTSLTAFVIMGARAIKKVGVGAVTQNRRLFGAIVAHIGVTLMAFGITFSALYTKSDELNAGRGDVITIKDYSLLVEGFYDEEVDNYQSAYVAIDVTKDGSHIVTLYPEIRVYNNHDEYFAEVAYYSTLKGDLYVIFQGYDAEEGTVNLKIMFQPMIIWIWVGCVLMFIGGIYAATHRLPEIKDEK